ncbi:MAG: 16S rRNA (uracil(1498)-N(3))-methyltransferase [Thiotrichales bacterium]
MRSTRIFQDIPLEQGTEITLSDRGKHHLVNVLRARVGSPVILFNGHEEIEALGRITVISKKDCIVLIEQLVQTRRESPLRITLVQAISASDKMDFTLQKSVELGVSAIHPVFTERSQRPYKSSQQEKKLRHWQGVIEHACEQSGRCLLPRLHPPCTLLEYLKSADRPETRLLLSPTANQGLKEIKPGLSLELHVGPEGGYSEEEVRQLTEHDIEAVKLGERILRTETAGIAVISWLQVQHGDLG